MKVFVGRIRFKRFGRIGRIGVRMIGCEAEDNGIYRFTSCTREIAIKPST